jgi:hypothetical protein
MTAAGSQKAAAEEPASVIVIGRILARLLKWEQLDDNFAHAFVVTAGLDALSSCATTTSSAETEEAIAVLLQWMNKLTNIRLAAATGKVALLSRKRVRHGTVSKLQPHCQWTANSRSLRSA